MYKRQESEWQEEMSAKIVEFVRHELYMELRYLKLALSQLQDVYKRQEAGVLRACHKRPISVNQINQLVDEVETEIFNREEKEIPSSLIGELVMDKLKDLEAVAYVRFASVYREFKDVNTFMSELKKMLDK